MYRQGLTELQIEDCSEKQPKQLCQIINNLSSKQKIKLWKYLEKNIQPTKPQSQHSDYYERQYQRYLYTEHLSLQDINYIKQFTQENQELLIVERKQLLMDGYFKNRDIFDYDIYKFIQMCDRKKSVKIDRQYIFQEKQKKERTNNYTQVFKQALQTTTNQQTDNMSAKLICESINSLSGQQQQQFWQLAVENFQPQKTIGLLKNYYRDTYQRALYDGQVTNEDKKYIYEFCQNIKDVTTNQEVTQQLENSYFKDRNIFHYDIYYQVRNALQKNGKQVCTEQKCSFPQKQKYDKMNIKSQEYVQVLDMIQPDNHSIKSPKEICLYINQLDKISSKQFWTLYSQNNHTTISISKKYFRQYFCCNLYSEKLNDNDKQYILNYVTQRANVTTTELTQQLFETEYFKMRDIFYWDVYEIVHAKKRRMQKVPSNYHINESKQLQLQYTQIYKQGLNHVFGKDYQDYTPQQLCTNISLLGVSESLKFWHYLTKNVTPKVDARKLKSYFNTTYQQNQFSDSLTQNDIQQIAIEYEKHKNKSLTKIEITKLIIDSVFKTRDLFFKNVYKQVAALISKQQKLKGKKPQLIKEKGTCSLCNKPNVYIFCLQCNLFFCQLCKAQHIDDSMHFEFK
ncbi:B-box-type_zinc finger [Hexamita inflata]|uniref:B-box-type_zinc finger n=1 Tax=Hexamita inflata TaxID=28002 RepID=A0ABP1IA81_9EUKA